MLSESQHDSLNQLSFLIGKWNSHGMTLPSDGQHAVSIAGTDTYEWGLEKHFIVHTVDVQMGEETVKAIEYIGSDGPNAYVLYAFDNQGKITMMMASINKSGQLVIQGDGMRSVLQYHPAGNEMSAHWERSSNGQSWKPWMTMHFTKDS